MSKTVQIRNVPDALHRKLKARAGLAGMSLSSYLLKELRISAERPTIKEFQARLARLTPVTLTESSEDAIRAERDSR
jgi:plasmid stability protein